MEKDQEHADVVELIKLSLGEEVYLFAAAA